MKILAVDDERIALETLVDAIHKVTPESVVYDFRDAEQAITFAADNFCDIAFLDIEMREMSGIELARQLKGLNKNINIIFVTGYCQYMGDSYHLRASGYVLKPATPDNVKEELENLRNPVRAAGSKRIYAQTFGNFEIFVDEHAFRFKYSLSKELLAYLIDRRGALCTNGELQAVLWEDDTSKSAYLRKLKADLVHSFESEGCIDALVIQSGKIGIDANIIECDYFDWYDGKPGAINAYHGEYMTQYSWAEITHSEIDASLRVKKIFAV